MSWEQDVRLTNNPAASQTTSITVSGSNVHVLFVDNRTGTYQLYYKRSTNEGISWEADIQLSSSSGGGVSGPSLKVSGSFVHVFWHDFRDGSYPEIYYKRSTDGGLTWGADIRLTNAPASSISPSCGVSGSVVHVVWGDNRDGTYQVYYKYSADAGVNWDVDTKLSNSIMTTSLIASLTVLGSNVHVVWHDNRDGNNEIYYKRSTNGGISWGTDTRLTYDPANSLSPCVEVSGSNVHIVWYDNRDGNNEIYYKLSTDKGLNWGTDTRLTNDTSLSRKPFISISNSILNVVWDDNRDGNMEIYYKRNPTGNPIGIVPINSEIPKEYKLMQNYPNPFNPVTKINFDIAKTGFVSIIIYDALGREVETLVNEVQSVGSYNVAFNGANLSGGVYFCRMQSDGFSDVKKLVLLK
ncbi:MAG: T9SS type A sorting domain-containing protein [Ignavibacteriae bacterium]|nr:T9SS type A sorting domain-containing protein [Ignavibacteriota bacterium]